MFKQVSFTWMLALAAVAATALMLSAAASAAPSPNLSFGASSDGASASWSSGKGSAIDLTLGSDSATTYAEITLHHVDGVTVGDLIEPTFSTTSYGAGSPRYYITLSNGDSLWGYPLSGSSLSWAINNGNTYVPWTTVQQSNEASATVTGAYVIADGDQAPGTTDSITGLSFNGIGFN